MNDRKCMWCYRAIGEIRAAIEAQGGKQPGRIFDRDDAWARCVLCKSVKSGKRSDTSMTGGQPAFVRVRHINRKHGTDNRE